MTHYGLFKGRDLPGSAVDGGPGTLIVASSETEVWQHIFDLAAAHLWAGASNAELEFADAYQWLLVNNPPHGAVRADPTRLRQWLDRVEGQAGIFYRVFSRQDVHHLPGPASSQSNAWLMCTDVYFADQRHTDQWAFCLRGPRGGEVIVYTDSPEAYQVGASYVLTTPPAVPRQDTAQHRPGDAPACIALLDFSAGPTVLLADSPRQARIAAIAEIGRYVDSLYGSDSAETMAGVVAAFLSKNPFPAESASDADREAWLSVWNMAVYSPCFVLSTSVIDARL